LIQVPTTEIAAEKRGLLAKTPRTNVAGDLISPMRGYREGVPSAMCP